MEQCMKLRLASLVLIGCLAQAPLAHAAAPAETAPAADETIMSLAIGDAPFRVAVDPGYLATSDKLPTLFAVTQAALPPGNRLVEAFVAEADAERAAAGNHLQDVFLQVQTLRNAESLRFSDADWAALVPQIRATLVGLDANAIAQANEAGAARRMSDAAGASVAVRFGEVGKPAIYAEDADSLRFLMLVPVAFEVDGKPGQVTLECAGAIARVSGRLVYLYAYLPHAEGSEGARVRAALDRFVDRAIALNH
jgi:hypothetical protein